MTHSLSSQNVVSANIVSPTYAVGSDEYLIALGELPNATDEQIERACEAIIRLDKKRMEALAIEKRIQEEAIAAEANKVKAEMKASEAITKLEKELHQRNQQAYAKKIGKPAFEALARIKACLANGNDGGVVAAFYDFKKKSKGADLSGELRKEVKQAFARYDGRE